MNDLERELMLVEARIELLETELEMLEDELINPVLQFNPDFPVFCSFCGKDGEAVEHLIVADSEPNSAAICDRCISVCARFVQAHAKAMKKKV